MSIIIVTGAAGLIGNEACKHFHEQGYDIVGIDNNMRSYFFGESASNHRNLENLKKMLKRYRHHSIDIRDVEAMRSVFSQYNDNIIGVIHTAAQPSHDWAAREPFTDFGVNAVGTLNVLELTRIYCQNAVFVFTSTNKVYGDKPNTLPLVEKETRWEIDENHKYYKNGIDESMSIDDSKHSLFGASKVAADILVQEYGKYFNMKTCVFRGGCLTGPAHSGTELHGFLSYLVQCAITNKKYTIFGYKGKQVRDNIHSIDLISAFDCFFKEPRCGEVYNIGGSRHSNISILEAIELVAELSGKRLMYEYVEQPRIGDHQWYVSDVNKFKVHYPGWRYQYDIQLILEEIVEEIRNRTLV